MGIINKGSVIPTPSSRVAAFPQSIVPLTFGVSAAAAERPSKKMMEEVFFSSPLTIWPMLKFDADYSTLEKIGQGKYGEVFRIEERAAGAGGKRVRAAKVMRCARAAEKLRVRDEIEIMAGFDHPNVLRLIGAYEDSDQFVQGIRNNISSSHVCDFESNVNP